MRDLLHNGVAHQNGHLASPPTRVGATPAQVVRPRCEDLRIDGDDEQAVVGFTFDGRPMLARQGETSGAGRPGRRTLRTTAPEGEPRRVLRRRGCASIAWSRWTVAPTSAHARSRSPRGFASRASGELVIGAGADDPSRRGHRRHRAGWDVGGRDDGFRRAEADGDRRECPGRRTDLSPFAVLPLACPRDEPDSADDGRGQGAAEAFWASRGKRRAAVGPRRGECFLLAGWPSAKAKAGR